MFFGPLPAFRAEGVGVRPQDSQSAIVQTYKWAPGYVNMEVNYYVKGFGRVQWERWTLANGIYSRQQQVAFNTQVAGGVPALGFPCGVPVIG